MPLGFRSSPSLGHRPEAVGANFRRVGWPSSADDLLDLQRGLAVAAPPPWRPTADDLVGGCFVCFGKPPLGAHVGREPAWAAAALFREGRPVAGALVKGWAGDSYQPGLLALREGFLLEAAVRALPDIPTILLVNATGRDHPRRAGLALHLGSVLDVPTVGVTERPLIAEGDWPPDERGATSPLMLSGELVAYWLRTRRRVRPVAVHAAWRTDPEIAAEIVLGSTRRARTPEPIRRARHLARVARAAARGPASDPGGAQARG